MLFLSLDAPIRSEFVCLFGEETKFVGHKMYIGSTRGKRCSIGEKLLLFKIKKKGDQLGESSTPWNCVHLPTGLLPRWPVQQHMHCMETIYFDRRVHATCTCSCIIQSNFLKALYNTKQNKNKTIYLFLLSSAQLMMVACSTGHHRIPVQRLPCPLLSRPLLCAKS